jgi:hypothetical protein
MAKHQTGDCSRRNFLQASAAVVAVPLIAGGSAAAWADVLLPPVPGHDFYKVLFDRESLAAVAFGRQAADLQLPAVEVGREATSLWYDDLYHRWREGPAAIAGLTVPHVAFCLQILARDVGMRLMYRGEHTPLAGKRIRHRLTGPADLLARSSLLEANWTQGTARLLGCCQAAPEHAEVEFISAAGDHVMDEQLVSWVIAPRPSLG